MKFDKSFATQLCTESSPLSSLLILIKNSYTKPNCIRILYTFVSK